MKREIVIRSAGLISPLGQTLDQARKGFASGEHFFVRRTFGEVEEWVSPIRDVQERVLDTIRREHALFSELDRSVLMAVAAAREACDSAEWKNRDEVGVVLGSSRGATATFETQFSHFKEHPAGRVDSTASPTTTLGNISTAVAQDLLCHGIECSHSITCSTALHGVLNAVGWIRSGMGQRFLVGGSEAALTEFTLSQMKALRIYTSREDQEYPCRPLNGTSASGNTFSLGEGAAVFALEERSSRSQEQALARIDGLGWGIEGLSSLTSLSLEGESFARSMRRAIASQETSAKIDLIIGHAPGTVMGDRSELAAVTQVFGSDAPLVVSPKWQIGHTFGASGAFGMLQAIGILNGDVIVLPAYREQEKRRIPHTVSRVMINAAGFGGNSCSVILSKV